MECDFENFIVVIKFKNYLEKCLLCILLHILFYCIYSENIRQ